MTNPIKTEFEHLKTKAEAIKAKVEQLAKNSDHADEITSLHYELDDLVNRINSLLPHI